MEYTLELDQKMKRFACEWVLYKHPLLEKENASDKEWADWYDQLVAGDVSEYERDIDAALHPHRKRFILTADGWQYAIRYRKLSSPFRFCHDALSLQPQYQRQVEEALC